jgi:hypothetical protein
MSQTLSQIQLLAILPRLSSHLGHAYPYQLSVQRSVESLGWKYFAFFPKRADVQAPLGWEPLLANDISSSPKGLFSKILILLQNIRPFRQIFRRTCKESIVFIEHFELPHLGSIALSLLFLNARFQFWMLHRYETDGRLFKSYMLRAFHWFLQRKLGKSNVKFLTDSDLLAMRLSRTLKCNFSVVPIPHTEIREATNRETNQVLFWWPGGLIREDKGLSTIIKLTRFLRECPSVRIVVSEKMKDFNIDPSQCIFVPNYMSRDDYIEWMRKAHLILLPYSAEDYSCRTSGIFVEAISLGSIPVVTEGTWMAYELKKFDLRELIVTWKESNLMDQLCLIPGNLKIGQKIEKMRRQYHEFHSEKGFATQLNLLNKFDCFQKKGHISASDYK